jgi:hypothetical protein
MRLGFRRLGHQLTFAIAVCNHSLMWCSSPYHLSEARLHIMATALSESAFFRLQLSISCLHHNYGVFYDSVLLKRYFRNYAPLCLKLTP